MAKTRLVLVMSGVFLLALLLVLSEDGSANGGVSNALAQEAALSYTTSVTQPAATINLGDIKTRIERQASYRTTITVGNMEPLEATIFREPRGIYVTAGPLTEVWYLQVGARAWLGFFKDTTETCWVSTTVLEQEQLHAALRTCEDQGYFALNTDEGAIAQMQEMYMVGIALIHVVYIPIITDIFEPEVQAMLSQPDQMIDGIVCHVYSWEQGDTAGSVCVTPEGLPLYAVYGTAELHFSHYNDPANVVTMPLLDFPDLLHRDAARMALNGLSSFQWTASIQLEVTEEVTVQGQEDEDPVVFEEDVLIVYHGTYMQRPQVWAVEVWRNEEKVFDAMQLGDQWWSGLNDHWFPLLPDDPDDADTINISGPFGMWRIALWDTMYTQVAGAEHMVNGVRCNEYSRTAENVDAEGVSRSQTVRLFISVDDGLPLYLERVDHEPSFTRTITWGISNINAASNVIQIPEELGYPAASVSGG
ncbi:MAG: hypothetical protein K8S97_07720 [Anaerolineae bacterium]|nr:hypothetical protein [Anaerolineae bacterium]